MENQPIVNPIETTPVNLTPVNQQPVPVQTKTNLVAPILLTGLVCAVVFGIGGYYLSGQSKKTKIVQERIPITREVISNAPVVSPNPTVNHITSAITTYTYNTFSISYPKTWQVYDSVTNKNFFTKNNLTGFDHLVALQNGTNYLIIGIDTKKTGAEVGGIFTSEADRQEYLKNHDEIVINGDKFFLWKGDTRLSVLTDPKREAGIYALASLSKYVPDKVTNERKQTFNGYDDYMQMQNGSSYMVMKLSTNGNNITPAATQAEFEKVLETIHW